MAVIKTVEFKKQMEDIEQTCHVEFNGMTVLKDIHIIVIRYLLF